jgi:hypothetical protein
MKQCPFDFDLLSKEDIKGTSVFAGEMEQVMNLSYLLNVNKKGRISNLRNPARHLCGVHQDRERSGLSPNNGCWAKAHLTF